MKHFLRFIVMLLWLPAVAQSGFWSNAGSLVSIKDGAYLSVIGNMHNSKGGHYNNSDSIFLTGNWENTAGNHAFDSIDAGYVYMYAADQRIYGSDQTYFYNLVLKNQGVKFADIDAKVDGFLDLTDREFRVDTNTIWVRNADLTAVRRSSGFLSSLKDGGLLRYTNRDTAYLFPVGSAQGTLRYRPVTITPGSTNANQFKARFANVDPTFEGYDRDKKFHLICSINPNWYHRLYHPQGSDSSEIAIFYDDAQDGAWDDIVHWQHVPQWERIRRDTILSGSPFTRINKTKWNNFTYSPFALGIVSEPFATAGVDTIIWKYDTIRLNAQAGVNYQWSPEQALSCANCNDPYAFPLQSTIYYLTVEDSKGCFDFDSLYILVREKPLTNLFIPDVITPNGDGINDFWHIRDLERYPNNSVRVINRWGDEVMNESPYGQSWRGTWNGKDLPGATYYFVIKIKNDEGKEAVFNGPITVIR
ncbi:MAG: gliding motility-associated C-terminal domain-containing protein [Chitinophagales bacterium]